MSLTSISISVIIPCRNERGNIENIIKNFPVFSHKQEFIFVEGHSIDGTYEEITRIIELYPNLNIKLFKQPLSGKADAMHFGCQQATGVIIIIFDADLTVAPSDALICFQHLVNHPRSFVNSCRLNNKMEYKAMPALNYLGNTLSAFFFRFLTAIPFKDTLCGLKGFYKADYLRMANAFTLFKKIDPFGDFDLLLGAYYLKLPIIHLPVTYKCRQYGKSQIHRLKDSWALLRLCAASVYFKFFRLGH